MSPRVHAIHSDFEPSREPRFDVLMAGERFGVPSRKARGNTFAPAALVIALALGGVWGALRYPGLWQTAFTAVSSLMERKAAQPPTIAAPQPAPLAEAVTPPLAPGEMRDIVQAPGADTGTAVPPAETATDALPNTASGPRDAAPASDAATPEPLTPPKADPRDPNQKRALAAGLHPDVSPALLARLSNVDYRNAATAITTALSAAAPDEVYTWPKDAGLKRAQFDVRFVQGAGPECRRYVVTVTLERWSTTAPAMEKCGAELPRRKAAR